LRVSPDMLPEQKPLTVSLLMVVPEIEKL
jgi:hypothetical protein